jgi:hypothetical protein
MLSFWCTFFSASTSLQNSLREQKTCVPLYCIVVVNGKHSPMQDLLDTLYEFFLSPCVNFAISYVVSFELYMFIRLRKLRHDGKDKF